MYCIYNLKCNEMTAPVGIDSKNPVFSWKMKSSEANTYQSKYQINVYQEAQCVWDSGLVDSEQNRGICYEGLALKTGHYYEWDVTSIDNHGNAAKSERTSFVTGIMDCRFWKAKWIEADETRKEMQDITDSGAIFAGKVSSLQYPEEQLNKPAYFRKEFVIQKKVKRAVAFATAHGIYELRLDGTPISPLLAPEYTSYKHFLEYQTMDVTGSLQEGKHAIACILADGWYTGKIGLMGVGNQYGDCNAFCMQLHIEYEDGTAEDVVSDETYRWSYGAYEYADLFVGEYYHPEKEPEAFDRPGFLADTWKEVLVKEYGFHNLKGCTAPPVVIKRKIRPTLLRSKKGEWILDAGENIVGYTSFTITGQQDGEISLEHSEVLDADGNFLQNIMGQHKNQKDRVVLVKGETVTYCPKFTFHGFRYVKISGLTSVQASWFTIAVIGSDLEKTGDFETCNERINKLQQNIVRSQEGNMLSVPTDCPQRERAGWTGDMQVYTPTAAFNMDVNSFLNRWLSNMRLEQLEDGQVPNVIPAIDSNKYIDGEDRGHICSAGWGDACVIVPYRLYQTYGDRKILEENFEMMEKWMHFVASEANENGLWNNGFHFGDWLIPSIMEKYHDPMKTALLTKEEVATTMYAYTTSMMIDICNVLGKKEVTEHYIRLNAKIRKSFSDTYISEDGNMRQPLQGLYVLALQMNMVEEEKRGKMIQNLVSLIHKAGDCLDTGFLSVPFLLDILCECGEQELAYKMLYQDKGPSWLYAIDRGATTIWENWFAILPDGTRTNASYNHFAFGCVGDFLYRRIGGLQIEQAGYTKIRVCPDFICGLDWVKTKFDTVCGECIINWERREKGYHLEVLLPPGTEGIVDLGGEIKSIGNGYYEFDLAAASSKRK